MVQISICLLISLPIYYFAFEVFQLPHAAGWPSFLVFTLAFTIALHSLGTFMSSIATNAVNASRYGMVVALPSFIVSGFTWPLEAMPQWFQPLAWLLPQTWFFQGISYLSFKNPGWEFLSHYLLTFAFMAVIFYSLAALFTKGIPSSRFFRFPGNTPDKGMVPLSRLVKRGDGFENTQEFKVVPEVNSYEALEKSMKNGAVRAGVVIPEDYSEKLSGHQLTEIATIYDGSNLILGLNTRKYFQQVLNNFSISETSSYLGGLGLTKNEITNTLDTISFRMQIWYNPTLSYVNSLFMGLVIMILHQIGLLGIGLTVMREREGNSWIQFLSSGVPSWKIFFGKALPYFIANFFNYSLLLWIAARFVNVKIQGSLSIMIAMGLLFDVILVSIGFLISLYAKNSLQITRYLMLLSVPLFVLSGYSWPSTHLPEFLSGLARLMPFTWMADGFRLATIKNLSIDYLGLHLAVLAAIALASATLAMTWSTRNAGTGSSFQNTK